MSLPAASLAAAALVFGASMLLAPSLPQDVDKKAPPPAPASPPPASPAPAAGEPSATLPQPPADARPLPPVQAPYRTTVERKDLLQRFTEPNPLEGFYSLVSFARPGLVAGKARGYLVMGRRHLSIHLEAVTADGEEAHQSGFRSYRIAGKRLLMTTLAGMTADPDGVVRVDPGGIAIACSYSLLGTKLNLQLDDGTVLQFERLE